MKTKKIIRNILIGIAVFLIAVLLILRFGVYVVYGDYFSASEAAFRIPGLTHNFVPQGFDYMEKSGTFLMAGYMSDDTASRVYVRTADGKVTITQLLNADGTAYTQHAGGICHYGPYAYLPSDSGIDVFDLSDIVDGEDATVIGSIPTGHDMAFCTFHDGYLLAGNFYYAEHYETPEHHRLDTPAGDRNTAVITVFKADENAQFGIDPNAVAAISIREKVQGMCFTDDGQIVLSTSWGLSTSVLYFYEADADRVGTMQTLTGEVPLYYLDSANLVDTVKAPPMAEELVFLDGKVHVLNESSCNKYIFGRLIGGGWVYAYDTEK